MTREELASALEMLPVNDPDWRWDLPLVDIVAAARKQLALMPEKCPEPECDNGILKVGSMKNWTTHASCHGSGKVYPQETVEKIAAVFSHISVTPKIWAVAVLDALGETE